MTLAKRYRRLSQKAHELHNSSPWIHSDAWLEMFLRDLDLAFDIKDMDEIQQMEKDLNLEVI